ncbi:50S ribosomal protein L32e [archaeon]|nr:50S ribosomal protein L32e [archaeon]
MVETKTTTKRKKPKFYRSSWNKMHKLGKKVKAKRKWRASKGRDSKVRLRERGYSRRPAIGWGADKTNAGKVNGYVAVRVETEKDFEKIEKGQAAIIASVGKKKRMELIKIAETKKIVVLNKYFGEKNATS